MHVYTFLHHIHPLNPFPRHLPSPPGANPSPWTGSALPSCSLILQKRKRKDKKKKHDMFASLR
jgi:hypothetical protein